VQPDLNSPLFVIDLCRTATISLVLFASAAVAQTDTNLPPVAAPTSRVQVQSITVVRSASQQADDFVAGLLRGLTVDQRVDGIAIGAAQADHTILQRSSGAFAVSTLFPADRFRRVLDKTAPRFDLVNGATTSVSNLLRLVTALANDGTISGFAEMRRNGWNALQLDSSEGGYSARLVIAPEAKLVYVIAMRGRADWRVWQIVDDAVFDELLAPRNDGSAAAAPTANFDIARAVAGLYQPDPNLRSLVFLKSPNTMLGVRPLPSGALQLLGAETATLLPRAGSWSTPDGSLTATIRKGELTLSSGETYRLLPLYQRPAAYILLVLLAALGALAALLMPFRPDDSGGSLALPKTFR